MTHHNQNHNHHNHPNRTPTNKLKHQQQHPQKPKPDSIKILKNKTHLYGPKKKKKKNARIWKCGAYSVAKLGTELLNNHGEAARDLVEHGVAEGPVWLRRDLPLGVPRRHLQLQQRVKVIWVPQNRTQTPHCSSQIRFSETTKHTHTLCVFW